ncbi:TetR/AcrR family transcriptional regulator [Rhodopseudomonas sp. BR0C11]|uniref:TetR/AcrR family transcriptional regulator n=1 Tax=Rhodopseudomonas sp. BR0C11 TaxID=2269370 RepID=UPI0013DFBF36|nr:TetR/AcrR family transcriptional regulator [Rhodopseudomonas sp. BR0C11]NEV77726.1 TetR/AcrR family transcriptional regulator [Rhodopseudomonas sp. BR0C11]
MNRTRSDAAESPPAIRDRLLDAAVECLIELGVAGTSTLAVQHRAGVSRGALLHHFPSREVLLAASVSELIRRNEHAVRSFVEALPSRGDRLKVAMGALAFAARQPAYLAELELWAVARTDSALRQTLIAAERLAKREIDRVHYQLFGDWAKSDSYAEIVALTQHFMRGLAISENVRLSPKRRDELIASWTEAIRPILERGLTTRSASKA